MKANNLVIAAAMLALAAGCAATSPAEAPQASKAERRAEILKMRDATLERLYKEQPASREVVAKAAGYAVFDATGVNLVLYVGGKGAGVLVDNATAAPTFMTMVRAGTGPGVGYKEFKQVIVFKTKDAMALFTSAGIDVGASFDFGDLAQKGQSFNPSFQMYTITDKGFTVQANWGGTKYFKDAELN
jgi:lipid-binding SYLF domain-containing protein